MAPQYHASIEIEITAKQQKNDYSNDICEAFTNSETYSHSATKDSSGKYLLDFFGDGFSNDRAVKSCCSKLAKSSDVIAFTLVGTLNNEESSGQLDAVRATYKNGTMLFEYWYDCAQRGELNLNKTAPSVYDTVRIDSTYFLDQYHIYIDDKSAIQEIVVSNSSEEVPANAFKAFHNLKKIDLPDTIAYIGPNAVVNCEKLTTINTPKNLKVVYEKSFVGCPNLKFAFPKEYVIIKPDGCAEYKEMLFDLISRLGNKAHELDSLFELLLSSSEVEKAATKIVKEKGLPLKDSFLFGKLPTISEYLSGINEENKIEEAISALFSTRTIEKMKLRYAIMVGLMKDMPAEEICKDTGASTSAVASVSKILYQSYWSSVKWFCSYCLRTAM